LSTDASTPAAPRRRYHSLDGLRGLAAFVVLICHSLLVMPAFMQAFVDPSVIPAGTVSWWATFSLLHLAWGGTEAVYLFFVLSGFVLTLPFVREKKGSWLGYYPKRALRIYVPVWGAFVLAVFWMNVFPRKFPADASWWLLGHPATLTSSQVRGDLFLWPPPLGSNPVLWSLTFEVIFSILLPLYVIASRKLPKLNLIKFILLLGAIGYFSSTGTTPKFCLPMFGLGTIMAVERHRLARWGERIRSLRFSGAVWFLLTFVALGLLNSYWTVRGLTTDQASLTTLIPLSRALSLLGACLAIFLAIEGSWGRWLEKPHMQWLGKRSFSLYLVHNPIVVSTAVLLGGTPGGLATLAITVPVSLLFAEGFFRVVERPSQLLGRTIEKGIESFRSRRHRVVLPVPVPVGEQSSA
jgi:peptidoglycan/LPS O-acetylase OafA/YrhL